MDLLGIHLSGAVSCLRPGAIDASAMLRPLGRKKIGRRSCILRSVRNGKTVAE